MMNKTFDTLGGTFSTNLPDSMLNPLGISTFVGVGIILAVVFIALKGYALWHAAQRKDRNWFIALLILNTMGILEMAYLWKIGLIGKKK